jgi:hypothetical protein
MMTEYHLRELKRAREIEKRGKELLGSEWQPSRWHISIYLKAEAEERNQFQPGLLSTKRFSRGWRTHRNKRKRLQQQKTNVDKQ